MADCYTMPTLFEETLVPGQVLAASMRHPETKAILLSAGTVLTEELIAQLHRADLANYAAICVGDERRDIVPPNFRPSLNRDSIYQISRLRQAYSGLRSLLTAMLFACGALAVLTGDPHFELLATGCALSLAIIFGLSMQLASRTSRMMKTYSKP
ncbi:MAG: hypothetical protein HY692_01930 [Cyanobacteria bacterium NC_groundwater_1444_Ag_S-0.65um_54_12]|nr:hypothetical protein [Cyanobacteria bacterium NC_groundwater_1444_Ag_S-0.65um_54_12]